jgi:succinate dehydrogenase / fumarate reductase cytochrome b subunit
MNDSGRPLSPHLSVYRWPITMTLSILHRATGAGLSVGFAVLAIWLVSAANGGECYARASGLLQSGFGRLLLIGWSFAFFFHLSNGVRHLFWDAGKGFEISQANASAWFAVILSVVLTMVFWIMIMVTL